MIAFIQLLKKKIEPEYLSFIENYFLLRFWQYAFQQLWLVHRSHFLCSQEIGPRGLGYPSDESGKKDIENDPNNDKSDSDDSNDWLPSLSNKPRDEFELKTRDDGEQRTANNNPNTSIGGSSIE